MNNLPLVAAEVEVYQAQTIKEGGVLQREVAGQILDG